jgi:hypothetical protein
MKLSVKVEAVREYPRVQVTRRGPLLHIQAGVPGKYHKADLQNLPSEVLSLADKLQVSSPVTSLAGTATRYVPLETLGQYVVATARDGDLPVILCSTTTLGLLLGAASEPIEE